MICRCCSYVWQDSPLLSYDNMPSIAQNLPVSKEVALNSTVTLNVLQCPMCGLIQLDESVLVPYYRDVIRSSAVSPEMMFFRQDQFQRFVETHNIVDKTFLEVGCGRGEYLSIMTRFVRGAQGIEHSDLAVNDCLEAGLNVHKGFIDDETLPFTPQSIESFGIFNFLEHMPNPVSFLRSIHSYLKPGAVGIVEVPNFDIMAEGAVFSDFSSEHLTYFTTSTLNTSLELSGFDILKSEAIWHGHILSAEVQVRSPLDAQSFSSRLSDAKSSFEDVLKGHSPSDVAVWGAGHQSLATIMQLGLQNSIGTIVDSSAAKQEKYAPGTDILIRSPDWLLGSSVRLLLINASSYSEEVYRMVSRDYPHIPMVYIVDNGNISQLK